MTDLVTNAAIDAAMADSPYAYLMFDHHVTDAENRETMAAILRPAAQFIAAEALRQAAKQYGDLNLAEWEKDRVRNYLTARADELEGK